MLIDGCWLYVGDTRTISSLRPLRTHSCLRSSVTSRESGSVSIWVWVKPKIPKKLGWKENRGTRPQQTCVRGVQACWWVMYLNEQKGHILLDATVLAKESTTQAIHLPKCRREDSSTSTTNTSVAYFIQDRECFQNSKIRSLQTLMNVCICLWRISVIDGEHWRPEASEDTERYWGFSAFHPLHAETSCTTSNTVLGIEMGYVPAPLYLLSIVKIDLMVLLPSVTDF